MRSMTGCGRGHAAGKGIDITIDVRSVNHRFLDVSARLGNEFLFLQEPVRKETGKYLKRGHIDITMTLIKGQEISQDIEINEVLADLYMKKAQQLCANYHCELGVTAGQLLEMPGVSTITSTSLDADEVTELAIQALDEALDHLVQMRADEGKRMGEDLALHLSLARQLREKILVRAPSVPEEYREKLLVRLENLHIESVDEARIAQEVALVADRCAIDEELARLDSHFQQMDVYLMETGEIGKKMDFLIQEMNREANTIGSKASDAEIAKYVVDLKSEIEKMREQVQNVE